MVTMTGNDKNTLKSKTSSFSPIFGFPSFPVAPSPNHFKSLKSTQCCPEKNKTRSPPFLGFARPPSLLCSPPSEDLLVWCFGIPPADTARCCNGRSHQCNEASTIRAESSVIISISLQRSKLSALNFRMTTGNKRARVVKGSKSGVQRSKAAVGKRQRVEEGSKAGIEGSMMTILKKAKSANKSARFIVAQCSKPAGEQWKKMTDEEKAPSMEMAKQRKGRMNKQIPKGKKKNALPVFFCRCSPLKLVKVNAALTKDQQDAVDKLGFGSILQLKCRMLNRDFISRLVKHFNPVTRSLEFGRVRVHTITPDDVRRALGLSFGTIPVPTNSQDYHFEHIEEMFGTGQEPLKPLKRGVTFSMMQAVFKEKKADVKFQTAYVLFVLSCFLCPTTKDVATTKFYPAMHDIIQTRTYAWAEFVLDWLANEIAKYKKRSAKGKKDVVGVAGCVFFLMFIYFDKQPMGMKVGSEGQLLIKSWTPKLIKERIAKEETLELVDPISERFPEPSYRHPYVIAAFHDLKKYFVNQMQHLDVMDKALMGDVPQTQTRSPSRRKASSKRKNRNEDEDDVDMGDLDDFPSTSTVNPKKVSHGVDVEDVDDSRMSGIFIAQEMPFYSPKQEIADVVQHEQHVEVEQHTVMEKYGDKQGQQEEDEEQEEDEDEEEEEDDDDDDDEGEGEGEGKGGEEEEVEKQEQVPFTPPMNKGPRTRLQNRKSGMRPSTKRGKRTLKPSQATRTPYVAPPEVKLSKLTRQENQVWVYVMQPPNKTSEEDVFKMDGGKIYLSHEMLHEVFKPRGHMSTLVIYSTLHKVMATMTEWLMKQEKANALMKDGVLCPTRHMFSSSFVLFLPVLLTDIEHWYCVVVNLVDKRIEVLDSMALRSRDVVQRTDSNSDKATIAYPMD
ncbi:hypothetical protein RHMOL_Rhmol01G0141600 [Rhododendron molle]|uniref:Uncharacterized protein n=1 Tax=Rhododendron molle TaxID=49168 RepID=A0ACC0Q4B7_RHOML|nr:hypothetical protein RHMOL_Rhmol01G0141600 [Rhododendron molle]